MGKCLLLNIWQVLNIHQKNGGFSFSTRFVNIAEVININKNLVWAQFVPNILCNNKKRFNLFLLFSFSFGFCFYLFIIS